AGRARVKPRYMTAPRPRVTVRSQGMGERRKQGACQESEESRWAPTAQPARTKPTSSPLA
ncbi:IS110 family transposase, partial [Rhodococcus sp. IEGM 1351]|nr:IS110 family transposase [Rhodococcus sp. IEGM 1351]